MTQATDTTVSTTTADTTAAAPAAPAAPKAPSKKSLAVAIFAAALADRAAGKFATNKEFRASVLSKIQADLGVSTASAATMYNAAKKDAETADAAVKLGRDPKKEKVKGTGKRGRPAGSKNKAKEGEAAPAADTTVVVNVPATETAPAADAAPAEAAA
jgi:hypothetical protein